MENSFHSSPPQATAKLAVLSHFHKLPLFQFWQNADGFPSTANDSPELAKSEWKNEWIKRKKKIAG